MPETCHNCGAELYEGQQFCRRCGVPVGAAAAGGEAPTQLFPAGAQTGVAAPPAGTSPIGGAARAAEVARRHPGQYQPPAAAQQTSALVGEPFASRPLAVGAPPAPKRRRRGVWLFALLAVFLLGAGLACGAAFLWWRARHPQVVRIVRTGPQVAPPAPEVPGAPPLPADLGQTIKDALKSAGVPLPVDESGAVVTGSDTVLTQTYELGDDATFALHSFTGGVTVTGTDGDRAVVKIIKHGGSAQERAAVRVLASKTDEGLALLTTPTQGGGVTVSYEVGLPRGLKQLAISADRGDVRVSNFEGAVTADVKSGGAEFRDVSGAVRSRVIKGDTRVFFTGAEREGAQEFSVVKGNIEAAFADGANADLKAQTLDGDIDVDDGLGLRVERGPAGRHVAGRVGEGGEALLFKVTNGDIKLKK
ncbi:MAG TPA: DUF4097 family beta strand repeat-containing protein [Pyrinomonadaceae bacterium]|jgi:hypothetical protein